MSSLCVNVTLIYFFLHIWLCVLLLFYTGSNCDIAEGMYSYFLFLLKYV